ncbi:hypothetical protein BBJ28_00003944 [Nothophytophthora sp. Chile5]|nr:hypothetical protein BBJ28_00003944 [Nothophytophthora sp. Chile5]
MFDSTGITDLLAKYSLPICGLTEFTGEVDDGTDLSDTLGLTIIGDAFKGTTGSWTKEDDGVVMLTFQSSDTKDVTMNIKSGGEKIAEVVVDSGETVTWNTTVVEIQDKTLCLNRARPGVMGIKGTGGSSEPRALMLERNT